MGFQTPVEGVEKTKLRICYFLTRVLSLGEWVLDYGASVKS